MRTRLTLMSETSSSNLVFEPVAHTAISVAIIASGPSFQLVNFRRFAPHVHIIAVKGAIEGIPRAHTWMTVDANRKVRQMWMGDLDRKRNTYYYAAVPADYGTAFAEKRWHRPKPEDDIHFLRRIAGEGLSEDKTVIHTGNSAWGALGLAYHMGARKIGLFGIDGTQERYGVGMGYPRGKLDHLPALFLTSLPQLERSGAVMRNAGKLSSIPQEPAREVIEWLNAV